MASIDAASLKRRAYAVLALLALANLISYALRNALLSSYDDLRRLYALTDSQIGLLATVYIACHAIATVGFGWFGDRFDRRAVIAVGLAIASIASFGGSFAVGFYSLAASRALVGFGTAAVVPLANSILGELFEGPRKSSTIALFNLGMFFGGLVGYLGGSKFGFPSVVVVLAIPGIFLALGIRVVPMSVAATTRRAAGRSTPVQFLRDAKTLVRIRTLRWLMASATSMAFAAGGYLSWILDFLQVDKGMTKAAATNLLSLCMVGGLAGVLTGGRLADRWRAHSPTGRMKTIIVGMFATVPFALGCVYLPVSVPLYYLVSIVAIFFISWYHAPMATTVDDLAPPALAATAQGLVVFLMHLVGTAMGSWVVGQLNPYLGRRGAMMVPTFMIAVAACSMAMGLSSFARDRAAATGESPPAAL